MAKNAISVNQLKFSKVVIPNKREIGVIDDIVVHQDSQEIAYVILKMRGLMGFGDKRIPVPVQAFELDTDQSHQIILNIGRKKLKNAPMIEPEDLPTFDLNEFMAKINAYYYEKPKETAIGLKLRNLFRFRPTIDKKPFMQVTKSLPTLNMKSA